VLLAIAAGACVECSNGVPACCVYACVQGAKYRDQRSFRITTVACALCTNSCIKHSCLDAGAAAARAVCGAAAAAAAAAAGLVLQARETAGPRRSSTDTSAISNFEHLPSRKLSKRLCCVSSQGFDARTWIVCSRFALVLNMYVG